MIRYLILSWLILLMPVGLLTPHALAEEKKEADLPLINRGKNEGNFVFSSKIPESPALALAGLDASKVTRATEVRKFALSVPSSFDGDTRQAIALDLSPSEIFFEDKESLRTLDDYVKQDRRFYRIARRTKVSLVVQGGKEEEDADKSIKSLFAIGATTSLLDNSDPLFALGKSDSSTDHACVTMLDPALAEFMQQDTYSEATGSTASTLSDINYRVEEIHDANPDTRSISPDAYAEISRLIERTILVRAVMQEYATSEEAIASGVKLDDIKNIDLSFDPNNPRDSLNALTQVLKNLLKIARSDAYQINQEIPASITKLMKDCQSAIAHSLEMGAGLDVGAAMIWRGDPGGLGDFDNGAQALWLSARKGIWDSCARVKNADGTLTPHCDPAETPRYAIAGLSARVANDETVSTGNDDLKEAKADTWQAWGGIEYFSDKWRLAGRYGYQDTDFQDPLAQSFSKSGELWQVDGDIRLNETLWVGLSYGKAAGSVDALDGQVFKLTLKFSEPKKLNVFAR